MSSQGARSAAPLAGGLQAVFAAELEEQLQAAAAALPLASQGSDRCHELRRIFHTIKGGAGLVGRLDLAETAGQLEHFFADPQVGTVPEQAAFDVLFSAANLPPPALAPVVSALRAPTAAALRTRAVLLGIGPYRFALPLAGIERAAVVDASQPPPAGDTEPRIPLHDLLGLVAPVGRVGALVLRGAGATAMLLADRLGAPCDLAIAPAGPVLAGHPFVGGLTVDGRGIAHAVLDADRLIALGAAKPVAMPGGSPRQVLAVDDSMLIRRAVADVLAEAGVSFDLATDGHDALAKLGRGRYAVVLTDLEMPRMDGYALIATLRGDARWRSQAILVCSSRPPLDRRLGGLAIQGYVAKPFAAPALLAALQPFVAAVE